MFRHTATVPVSPVTRTSHHDRPCGGAHTARLPGPGDPDTKNLGAARSGVRAAPRFGGTSVRERTRYNLSKVIDVTCVTSMIRRPGPAGRSVGPGARAWAIPVPQPRPGGVPAGRRLLRDAPPGDVQVGVRRRRRARTVDLGAHHHGGVGQCSQVDLCTTDHPDVAGAAGERLGHRAGHFGPARRPAGGCGSAPGSVDRATAGTARAGSPTCADPSGPRPRRSAHGSGPCPREGARAAHRRGRSPRCWPGPRSARRSPPATGARNTG